MKDLTVQLKKINKVEFWAATTAFIFVLVFHLVDHIGSNPVTTQEPDLRGNLFIADLLRYIILYISFLVLNFTFVPRIFKKEAIIKNILLIILVFIFDAALLGLLDFFLPHRLLFNTNSSVTDIAWLQLFYIIPLAALMALYSVIKYTALYLMPGPGGKQTRYRFITSDILSVSLSWMIFIFWMLNAQTGRIPIFTILILPPSSIFCYSWTVYFLLPRVHRKKRPFIRSIFITILMQALFLIPTFLFVATTSDDLDIAASIALLNAVFQLLVIMPLSWIHYKRNAVDNEEIHDLKKELGQTHAQVDLLRSQINPHFLFNVLNTVYGTAMQEKAGRTAEAIEKLSNMMRFMLHENMQEKIALSREIDYLYDYISLQRLRTDANPMVTIDFQTIQPAGSHQIVPMLLIPLVENAFKHGISFRASSPISIFLEVRENVLYFNVKNMKHGISMNDPEKTSNGIGLENVRQRLHIWYQGKHMLSIIEDEKEFAAELEITLN